jgi:hypothetical protein
LIGNNPTEESQKRRVYYVRYADDFLVGIIGERAFALKIQNEIIQFLKQDLHFKIKMKNERLEEQIVHARSNKVKFLGFDLKTPGRNSRAIVNTRRILSFKKLRNRIVNKKLILKNKYDEMQKRAYLEVRTRQLNKL